jgi:O-antigen ligase
MAVRDRLDLYLVAGSLVAVTMVEGVVGVYQYLTGTGASYAGQYVRAVGTFGAEQILAMGAVVGYGLLVTLALGLALRGRARIALLAAAAFLVLPLYLSLSRGSWIATALAVGVMMFVYSWRWTAALTATAIFAVAVLSFSAGPAGSPFGERLTSIVSSSSEPDRSVRDRYALWTAAVGIWADHPVVGVGLKDFAGYRDTYAPMSLSAGSDVDDPSQGFRREPLLSAHNQYLMVLAEQGTVGILAFGGLLGTLLVGALRRRPRDLPAPVHPRFFDLLAPGVMAWTLIDFTYGDIGAGPTGVILAILLGLVARRTVLVPRPEVTS